jgi:hypothetical protein
MKTKPDYKVKFQVIRLIINKWDPYGLLKSGAPQDELDREVASIAGQIPRIQSAKDAAYAVSRVFSSSFEPHLFKPNDCMNVGAKLYQALLEGGLLK